MIKHEKRSRDTFTSVPAVHVSYIKPMASAIFYHIYQNIVFVVFMSYTRTVVLIFSDNETVVLKLFS